MKVLHLRASNFYGGPERQLHIHALKARGSEFDITVGSFTEQGKTPGFLQVIARDSVPVQAFEVKSAYDRKSVGLVKSYLKENDIDILCSHDYRTHIIGLLATRCIKTCWVAFSRGWTSENLKIKLYHTLDKFVIRFADRIVAVSREQKRKLEALLVPSSKIEVAYNSMDPGSFDRVEKADLKKRFGFPDDTFVCVLGGRFSVEKGQSYLIDAARLALKQNSNLRFVLFGDGPDLATIKAKIERLGIARYALCPGFEKNLLAYIKTAGMLINPSLSEGLPNIVLEAMAFKIPVIATAVGGVPELIEDGVSGFLVPPKNPVKLAERVLELAEDEALRDEFGQAGYNIIIEKFSFDRQSELLYAMYRGILKND